MVVARKRFGSFYDAAGFVGEPELWPVSSNDIGVIYSVRLRL